MGTSNRAGASTKEPQLLYLPSVPDGRIPRKLHTYLTPWSVFRDTFDKIAHMLDSVVRLS